MGVHGDALHRREVLFDIGKPFWQQRKSVKNLHANTIGNLVASVKSAVSDVVAYLGGQPAYVTNVA